MFEFEKRFEKIKKVKEKLNEIEENKNNFNHFLDIKKIAFSSLISICTIINVESGIFFGVAIFFISLLITNFYNLYNSEGEIYKINTKNHSLNCFLINKFKNKTEGLLKINKGMHKEINLLFKDLNKFDLQYISNCLDFDKEISLKSYINARNNIISKDQIDKAEFFEYVKLNENLEKESYDYLKLYLFNLSKKDFELEKQELLNFAKENCSKKDYKSIIDSVLHKTEHYYKEDNIQEEIDKNLLKINNMDIKRNIVNEHKKIINI